MTFRPRVSWPLVGRKFRLLRLRRLWLIRLHSTRLSAGKAERGRLLRAERRILRAEGILHPTLDSPLGSGGILHLRAGNDTL